MVSNGNIIKANDGHCLNSVTILVLKIKPVCATFFLKINIYSFQGMMNMHFFYGLANIKNGEDRCIYKQRFLHWQLSNRNFENLMMKFPLLVWRGSNKSMMLHWKFQKGEKDCNSERRFQAHIHMNFFFFIILALLHLCQDLYIAPSI